MIDDANEVMISVLQGSVVGCSHFSLKLTHTIRVEKTLQQTLFQLLVRRRITVPEMIQFSLIRPNTSDTGMRNASAALLSSDIINTVLAFYPDAATINTAKAKVHGLVLHGLETPPSRNPQIRPRPKTPRTGRVRPGLRPKQPGPQVFFFLTESFLPPKIATFSIKPKIL